MNYHARTQCKAKDLQRPARFFNGPPGHKDEPGPEQNRTGPGNTLACINLRTGGGRDLIKVATKMNKFARIVFRYQILEKVNELVLGA